MTPNCSQNLSVLFGLGSRAKDCRRLLWRPAHSGEDDGRRPSCGATSMYRPALPAAAAVAVSESHCRVDVVCSHNDHGRPLRLVSPHTGRLPWCLELHQFPLADGYDGNGGDETGADD